MGSSAHTAERPDDASREALPPTAASFWGEDSGSLQAPMQAPADAWQGRWEPPAAAPPHPPKSARDWRVQWPRLPGSLSGGSAPGRGRGATAVAGLLLAGVLLILAVIGETEGSTPTARQDTAGFSKKASIVSAAGVNRAHLRTRTSGVTEIKTEPASHHTVRSRAHKHRTPASNHARHGGRSVPRLTPAASQPVRTTTPTYIPTPATTAPSSGSTSSSPPAATARSTNSSSQHQPAFGPSGSLGPGTSPDS